MSNEKNELFDFMKAEATNMANEYTRIQKRSTEDPGTAGDQGEENWAKLFRNWLPPIFPVVTKGRILGISGGASPQVDILVLSPAYPHALLDKKLYLAGGVIAAFECKTTLKAHHISKAMECAVKIRKLLPNRSGTPYLELHSSILYGLLAHSHSWKARSSQPISKISETLYESDRSAIRHPREMVDLVCISDVATWTSVRNTFVGPSQVRDWDNLSEIYGKCGSATTAYMCHSDKGLHQESNFTPHWIMSHLPDAALSMGNGSGTSIS